MAAVNKKVVNLPSANALTGTELFYCVQGGFDRKVTSSLLGGSGVSDGDKGDITVALGVWTIDPNVVSNGKLATIPSGTFKARSSGGIGNVEDITGTQATALLDIFSSTLKGVVPLSGGGSTNFLRADGTWAVPPVGSSGITVGTTTVGSGTSLRVLYDNAGIVGEYTNVQLTALMQLFTTALSGAAPASGGGTVNFLRADGSWAAPSVGAASIVVGTTTVSGGTTGNYAFNNGGIYGEKTPTQLTADVNVFTTALKGAAPASGGGTTNFLRADGSWIAPPGAPAGAALTKTDDTNVTLTLGGTPATALLQASSITAGWTGTLGVARGGIGVGTITGLMQGTGTTAVTGIANSSTVGQALRVTGASTYAWGALDLSTANAVTNRLAFANLAQGSARSVLGVTGNATADVASIQGTADQALVINGAGTALTFGTVATNGITANAVTYAKMQALAATSKLLGSSSTTTPVQEITLGTNLSISGTTLNVAGAGVTPAALTKTDDTNVTLTLGGTPTTALLQATSVTVGWTGILAAARGGTANGFTQFSGPASSAKTYTLPNSSQALACLDLAGQTLSGGATCTTFSNGSSSFTVDCGKGPIQSCTITGAFTITNPAADGSCIIIATNSSATSLTFSAGFTAGSNTGDAYSAAGTNKYSIFIWRAGGVSGYRIAAHQ